MKRNCFAITPTRNPWWLWLVVWFFIALAICVTGLWWRLHSNRLWDGQRRLTWAAGSGQTGEGLELWSLEPETGLTVIRLPAEVKVKVTYGYNDYLIGGLYGLAKQEKKPELLTKTLEYELGIPVEGYLIQVKNQKLKVKNKEDFLKSFKDEIRGWWMGEVESNFSWGDRVWLWTEMEKLRSDQVRIVDFGEGNWARQEKDVDGQPIIWFDHVTVDSRLPEWLSDTKVNMEGRLVGIVNTTGIDGLGGQIARIAGGLGAKVIEVRDAGGGIGQCVVAASREVLQTSYLAQRLKEVFDCTYEEKSDTGSRTDIELRVGFEQGRVWRGIN